MGFHLTHDQLYILIEKWSDMVAAHLFNGHSFPNELSVLEESIYE
jgi:hypothetical protein